MTQAAGLHLVGAGEGLAPAPLIDQVQVLNERPGGLFEAMVPAELINREEVPVDQAHVDELVASMRIEAASGEGTGQLSPILLGTVPGHDKFFIIDGFHRDASLNEIGQTEIFATVRPNCTMEEILDLRILTATMHEAVSFARVVEWVSDAWSRSHWAEQITVTQAFSLAGNASSGKILKLNPGDVQEIQDWVADKCEKWNMSNSTIFGYLNTAQQADPELVKEARRREGGRTLDNITPAHLTVIAKLFPHDYAMQQLAAGIAKANNMNIPTTRAVVQKLMTAATFDDARRMAEITDWSALAPVHSKSRTRELRQKERDNSVPKHGVTKGLILAEVQLGKMSLENLVLRGRYLPPVAQVQPSTDFVIDYHGDQAIEELIRPNPTSADALYDALDRVQDPVLRSLRAQSGLTEAQLKSHLSTAVDRIIDDIREGDLRHVDHFTLGAFRSLLSSTTQSQLQLKRPPMKVPKSNETPAVIDIDDALQSVPGLLEVRRKALVLRGLLRLTSATIGTVVGRSPATVGSALEHVYKLAKPSNEPESLLSEDAV